MLNSVPLLADITNDTQKALLIKLNNNLTTLFTLMSAAAWSGSPVGVTSDGCICSDKQILANIDNNIWSFFYWFQANGGGGAGGGAQGSIEDVATDAVSKDIAFATEFTDMPAVVCNLVDPDGDVVSCNPTNVTTAGFTAQWGFAIPAGYKLAWIATKATQ